MRGRNMNLEEHMTGAEKSEINDAEAIKWYLLAASQGNSKAQDFLHALELQNRGVTANYAEVEKLLQLAAEKKIFPAKEALEALQKQREAR
jgi:TPR repeat protein